MTDNKKRVETANYLERKLEASMERAVEEILDAERTETTTYERECARALELQEQAYDDFQRKLEMLIDAALARGETNIVIEIRSDATALVAIS
jgi:hypothetical protein